MFFFAKKSIREPLRKKVIIFVFSRRYVTPYRNVTILYADIVNYTKMTSKLKPVTILVETLNDLFGAFDDESDVSKIFLRK